MEPQPASPPAPSSPETAEVPAPSVEMPPSEEPEESGVKPDRRSSSSSSSSSEESKAENLFHPDVVETSIPLVVAASPDDEAVASGDGAAVRRPDDKAVASGDGAVVRPDDWASWPQQPAQTVDEPVATDDGEVLPGLTTQAPPEVQTMPQPAAEPAAATGFDPERIPASIFQAKPLASSSSQAEWSVASNESLFSIHGARPSADLCGFYAGESRSHFDYFYDEAMAAAGGSGGEPEWKLATVAEGSPGSARSDASGGGGSGSDRDKQKAAIAFRRHESGSGGSSSNFSFAFPILPETTTSPRKREYAGGGGAMYQPLQKELEQPPPVPSFEEMTTEEERRRRTSAWCCCCGECCGCCWFACSWSSCCCCCRWRWWWCCDCRCSCPTLCRCNWCICF
ncbi:hypothetical protein E2562_000625 [Oryza meyeriana var. granulata]|uniref:Uncharacterized protein n=1 Tax=Oryza meyeriana var. granulata TaxID=110450 RepID=A0A6G1DT34_9ORYZ|nr:hypothetical protein E2562_000625 [Oryza meyeriana var. granulata]